MNTRPKRAPVTRNSIIERIKNSDDQTAWKYFDTTYRKLIYGYALKRGLTHEEAEDVTQDTLLAVTKGIFKYDPERCPFKQWLFSITHRKFVDQIRKKVGQPPIKHRADNDDRDTATVDREPDLDESTLEAHWNQEWSTYLVGMALRNIKLQVSIEQYQIYDLYAVKGLAVAEVAKTLAVTTNQVYIAKSRIDPLMKKELIALRQDLETQPHSPAGSDKK